MPDVIVAQPSVSFQTDVMTTANSKISNEPKQLTERQKQQLEAFASARNNMLTARATQMKASKPQPNLEVNESDGDEMSDDQEAESLYDKLGIGRSEPLLSKMLEVDQYDLADLIDEFAEKVDHIFNSVTPTDDMESDRLSPWPLSRWIFSSLAAIDQPASAENTAAMRNFAKKCMATHEKIVNLKHMGLLSIGHSQKVSADSLLVDLDLFTNIVAFHFKQLDLVTHI